VGFRGGGFSVELKGKEQYNKLLFSRSTLISIINVFCSINEEVDRALVALPDFKSGVAG
jgi:hypothetical protein